MRFLEGSSLVSFATTLQYVLAVEVNPKPPLCEYLVTLHYRILG